MAIIDRVKARIETDLSDPEIQLMIDEVNQDVILKYGPHPNPATPITIELPGWRRRLVLDRAIDTDNPIVIKEFITYSGLGETEIDLIANDYRIIPPGFVIERLTTGSHSHWNWADRVTLTYTPVNDGDRREEVIIKIVMLGIQYDGGGSGLRTTKVGDVITSSADYVKERNQLMKTLEPWGGLYAQ